MADREGMDRGDVEMTVATAALDQHTAWLMEAADRALRHQDKAHGGFEAGWIAGHLCPGDRTLTELDACEPGELFVRCMAAVSIIAKYRRDNAHGKA